MIATVTPGKIAGRITAPASKSAMQRACAAALIRHDITVLKNPGISEDDKAALNILQQLGATVIVREDEVEINSVNVVEAGEEINCGESGLSVRMFTPLAALQDASVTVKGRGSLLKRPLHFFDEILPLLNVDCKSQNGFLPLSVKGPLQPASITIDGSLSSQYLTGLLFAYTAAGAQNVTITVNGLNSKPYIDLSLDVLRDFGLPVPVNTEYKTFYFPSFTETKKPGSTLVYEVEGDWSSGAFLLVAGAIGGSLSIKGLDVFSAQADKAVLQALMQTGVRLSIETGKIEIEASTLKAFHFNAVDCPDLFPPLVSLAAYCQGTSVIEGVHRLVHKESNRAQSLQQEFQKLGVEITIQEDLMLIKGSRSVKGAHVYSHHDHRIVMACAIAALRAEAPVTIFNAEAVNKSYPQFWQHLKMLGVAVSLNDN